MGIRGLGGGGRKGESPQQGLEGGRKDDCESVVLFFESGHKMIVVQLYKKALERSCEFNS